MRGTIGDSSGASRASGQCRKRLCTLSRTWAQWRGSETPRDCRATAMAATCNCGCTWGWNCGESLSASAERQPLQSREHRVSTMPCSVP